MRYDEFGRELPDGTPVEVPVRLRQLVTREQELKRIIQGALSAHAESRGRESFTESLDFEVEDDPFPASVHEFGEEDQAELTRLFSPDMLRKAGRVDQPNQGDDDGRREAGDGESSGVGAPRRDGGVGSGGEKRGASGAKAGDSSGGAAGV